MNTSYNNHNCTLYTKPSLGENFIIWLLCTYSFHTNEEYLRFYGIIFVFLKLRRSLNFPMFSFKYFRKRAPAPVTYVKQVLIRQ